MDEAMFTFRRESGEKNRSDLILQQDAELFTPRTIWSRVQARETNPLRWILLIY